MIVRKESVSRATPYETFSIFFQKISGNAAKMLKPLCIFPAMHEMIEISMKIILKDVTNEHKNKKQLHQ